MDVVVVGAAIVRDGRVLAARRSAPPALAGGWEFPGGKVEPGESEDGALMRECREELGVQIVVGTALGRATVAPNVLLSLYVATLVAGEPHLLQDHDELRWLAPGEFGDVTWLDADRGLVSVLRRHLAGRA